MNRSIRPGARLGRLALPVVAAALLAPLLPAAAAAATTPTV